MWDAHYAVAHFEELTGLKIEKVLEHRSVEWSPGKKESFLVFRVSGKAHPAFVLFDSDGMRKWGYILPCSKRGLNNEA